MEGKTKAIGLDGLDGMGLLINLRLIPRPPVPDMVTRFLYVILASRRRMATCARAQRVLPIRYTSTVGALHVASSRRYETAQEQHERVSLSACPRAAPVTLTSSRLRLRSMSTLLLAGDFRER